MRRKIINRRHPLRLALILAVFAAIIVSACDNTPDGVIPHKEMVSVLADLHTAESVAETERRVFANDSMKLVLKQSVLARYGYNAADFDSSLAYYGRNIDLYAKLYEDVISTLEDRIAIAESQGATENSQQEMIMSDYDYTYDGDSVDVWTMPRMIAFSASSPLNILPFSFSSDRFWERGDIYTLRGKMNGAFQALSVSLAVEYMDGSVDHLTMRSMGNGWKEASLLTDSSKVARYIYGTVSYPVSTSEPRVAAVLDSITLYRSRFNPNQMRDPRTRSVNMRR